MPPKETTLQRKIREAHEKKLKNEAEGITSSIVPVEFEKAVSPDEERRLLIEKNIAERREKDGVVIKSIIDDQAAREQDIRRLKAENELKSRLGKKSA